MRQESNEFKNKWTRATRDAIFERLERLLGPTAASTIVAVTAYADRGQNGEAIAALKAFDDEIGGYCGLPTQFSKPPGAYRPLGYIVAFLEHSRPREMARFVVDTICQHVENLLQRIARLGFLSKMSNQLLPMGALVASMRPSLPRQLYLDLQWLASEVYNHAKHSVDVFDRPTEDDKAHFFQLEEALAVYLIGRKLAVQLEEWSGRPKAQLMEEGA